MKKLSFNQNILTAGVVLALGIGGSTLVDAATSGSVSPSGGVQISNTATATYSVDGVAQPEVKSNAVVVNVSEVASFSLVATNQDGTPNDDKNEKLPMVDPNGSVTFTNKLTNNGNLADTYTIALANATDDNFDYNNITDATITATIKNSDGTTVGQPQTLKSGGTITLQPGQYAELSYTLQGDGNGVGGQQTNATITATSQYINKQDSSKATLTNTDNAIIKTPVFSIVKTASLTQIDLNNTTSYTYTIKVKNDGSASYATDADNVLIVDNVPAGLSIDTGSIKVSTDKGSAASTATTASTANKLVVNKQNIKVGETVTITFTVKITDKAALANAKSVTNHADVYDNYGPNPIDPNNPGNPDIHDSTNPNTPSKTNTPSGDNPKSNDPNNPGTGGDVPSTVNFNNRGLTLTPNNSAEIAPNGSTTYTHTLTNTGNKPESGLTFTIQDTAGDNIDVSGVSYTAPDGTKTTLTPTNGVYTIAGSLDVGQAGKIEVTVNSNNATLNTKDTANITVTPAAGTNDDAPAAVSATDTTTIKGMTLVKKQAKDETCDGTADSEFSDAVINDAKPGQCIVYRIEANNTFSNKTLTNVVIKDTANQWNTKADYVTNSIKDSANGATTAPGEAAVSSNLNIAAGQTGWLQFAVKIKTSK
ncbi:hypothetical protein [Faucicola atlantae]|uniref:hypothetical protein n=1 Tax=Faucicola atlantae TaxID=34059 RepID=UPI0025AFA28A|nr:hypothetical protein [Moraxella atlantae]